MGRLLIGRHCLAGPRIPSWRWPIEACPLPGTVSGSSSRLGLQGGPPPTPFPDCSPHPQPGPCCPARGSMEARAPGTQHRTRPKPAPHAEPSPEPSGAPAPSASLPSPGRELSNLVRSRTVRASTRGCVGPDRLEPRAAFRHSEPGLNGARGFPRVPGADARARWLCLVSARRVVGSAALSGSQPYPPGFSPSSVLCGRCGKGRPRAEHGASGAGPLSGFSGPGEQLLESPDRELTPDKERGPGAPGPWSAWGRGGRQERSRGGWG